MIPKTELELGVRAAERERYVINALHLYTKNTGDQHFHTHVPQSMASGDSAWGHLKYPQNKVSYDRGISRAVSDLKLFGVFEIEPQFFYRHHSEFYKMRRMNINDIEFGIFASKRTYRVLTEISKFYSIKDYKLFSRTMTGKKSGTTDFQLRFWKGKIRGYFYVEIDDLVEYGLITKTDGSAGYRMYSITEQGREFMRDNKQHLSESYRI